jgi:predicted secreted protein
MSIASAIVLFMVIWFMTFLVVLPLRIQTQGESGDIVPGTHSGSPQRHHLRKKAWIVTAVAAVLWGITGGTILSGLVTVEDIDLFDRMDRAETRGE